MLLELKETMKKRIQCLVVNMKVIKGDYCVRLWFI